MGDGFIDESIVFSSLREIPSQVQISRSIELSKEENSIDQLISTLDIKYNHTTLKAFLHAHFAVLQYFAGQEPTSFDMETYICLFNAANIENILEIGVLSESLTVLLRQLVGDSVKKSTITHIAPHLPEQYKTKDRFYKGYFDKNMVITKRAELFVSCGAISAGGDYKGRTDFTEELLRIPDVLSSGRAPCAIIMSEQSASIGFDRERLEQSGVLLYVNPRELSYLPHKRYAKKDYTDLVIIGKPK